MWKKKHILQEGGVDCTRYNTKYCTGSSYDLGQSNLI